MRASYAGIGSRATPPEWLAYFTKLAARLEEMNFILRSGGAAGADSAFEAGVQDPANKEIFLPWQGFEGKQSIHHYVSPTALEMASTFHPAWERCGQAARKFHGRNCYQVLGCSLTEPASFIICWTPNGQPVGGTGQALRIASAHAVPVFNFGVADPTVTKHDLTRHVLDGETS